MINRGLSFQLSLCDPDSTYSLVVDCLLDYNCYSRSAMRTESWAINYLLR